MQKALPSYTKQWEERDVIILNFGNPKPLIEDFQRKELKQVKMSSLRKSNVP